MRIFRSGLKDFLIAWLLAYSRVGKLALGGSLLVRTIVCVHVVRFSPMGEQAWGVARRGPDGDLES